MGGQQDLERLQCVHLTSTELSELSIPVSTQLNQSIHIAQDSLIIPQM
jgi:hypothetical protein